MTTATTTKLIQGATIPDGCIPVFRVIAPGLSGERYTRRSRIVGEAEANAEIASAERDGWPGAYAEQETTHYAKPVRFGFEMVWVP